MDFYLFDDGLEDELDDLDFDIDFDDSSLVFENKNRPLFYSSSIQAFTPRPRITPTSLRKASSREMAANAGAVSPSSSPRLPSPPPFTEVQIGPQSPTVGDKGGNQQLFAPLDETNDGSTRRIRPGTKAADMASGLPLIPLSQLDSPFQLQEHLKALYHNYTMPNGSLTVHPITHDVAVSLAHAPEGVERSLWLYELCRFLTMKVNNLIIAFFAEDPPCSQQSCPEMRASEWQYLCAVHDPPKSCCAIDYCCHTLDWATNILTSPKYFPSRLTLGSESGGGPQASMRHLTNIFRRLYRIFAHAWFQHRDVFRQVENTDGLYVFFKTVCDVYELIPQDNYTVPEEAERLGTADEDNDDLPNQPLAASALPAENTRRISVLKKDQSGSTNPLLFDESSLQAPSNISTGTTTRRHKHSPSTGSSVGTIAEANEDSNDTSAKLGQQLPKLEENGEDAKSGFIVIAEDSENDLLKEKKETPDEDESSEKEKSSEISGTNLEEKDQDQEAQTQETTPEIATKEDENTPDITPTTASDSNEQNFPTVTETEVPSSEEQKVTVDEQLSNGQTEAESEPLVLTQEESTTKTDVPESAEPTPTISVVEKTGEKDD